MPQFNMTEHQYILAALRNPGSHAAITDIHGVRWCLVSSNTGQYCELVKHGRLRYTITEKNVEGYLAQ